MLARLRPLRDPVVIGKLVTAIVLNYRTPVLAARCAESLLRQTRAADIDVVVVDNHSDDESIAYLRNRFPAGSRIAVWETHDNVGYGRGNNMAIERTCTPFVYITNPDNELEPEGVGKMLAAMEADPGIGILGPKLLHEDGTVRDSSRTFPDFLDVVIKRTPLARLFPGRMRRYLRTDADWDQVRDVDWIVGASLLIRRDVLTATGGFDPRFFLFFEDMDLCRRCWVAGKRVVYFPRTWATDRKRRLSEGGALSLLRTRTGRIHITSAIKYFGKWGWFSSGSPRAV